MASAWPDATAPLSVTVRAEHAAKLQASTSVGTALVLYGQLLQMPAVELAARVEAELDSNPALTRNPAWSCPGCGDPRGRGGCNCREARHPADDYPSRPTSVRQQLLADAAPYLDPAGRLVAEFILADLDHRGILDRPREEVAAQLGVDPCVVDDVIMLLRRVGAPSLAARDLRELMLLELDASETSDAYTSPGGIHPESRDESAGQLARRLISDCLVDLANGTAAAARRAGVTAQQVEAAMAHLRRRVVLPRLDADDGVVPAPPDVVIRLQGEGDVVVELSGDSRARVCVDDEYRRLCHQLVGAEAAAAATFVRDATVLVDLLERRDSTLRRVTEYVARHQSARLSHGPAAHVALTRAAVADALAIHPSTVSRAVAGKTLRLPDGQLISFASLFGASVSAIESLRHLLAEHAGHSDRELANALRDKGFSVSRRTVAKYRSVLGVPPAYAAPPRIPRQRNR